MFNRIGSTGELNTQPSLSLKRPWSSFQPFSLLLRSRKLPSFLPVICGVVSSKKWKDSLKVFLSILGKVSLVFFTNTDLWLLRESFTLSHYCLLRKCFFYWSAYWASHCISTMFEMPYGKPNFVAMWKVTRYPKAIFTPSRTFAIFPVFRQLGMAFSNVPPHVIHGPTVQRNLAQIRAFDICFIFTIVSSIRAFWSMFQKY